MTNYDDSMFINTDGKGVNINSKIINREVGTGGPGPPPPNIMSGGPGSGYHCYSRTQFFCPETY